TINFLLMKKIIFLPLFSFATVWAQTGPGGVQQTNGASNLVLWLQASTINQADATNVSSWADQSGYGNNAAAVAGKEPTYKLGILNAVNPVVRFTAANTDYLRIPDA